MTKPEIAKALEIAKSDKELNETNAPINVFDGYGFTNFKKVYVTLDQVARLIRWQCAYMSGGYDMEEFDNLCYHGKTKFIIVG